MLGYLLIHSNLTAKNCVKEITYTNSEISVIDSVFIEKKLKNDCSYCGENVKLYHVSGNRAIGS